MLDRLNLATADALNLMRKGETPVLDGPETTYPNGCPVLDEGPETL